MLSIPPTPSTQHILTQVDIFNRTVGYPHDQRRTTRQSTTEQYLEVVEDVLGSSRSQDRNERQQPTEQELDNRHS